MQKKGVSLKTIVQAEVERLRNEQHLLKWSDLDLTILRASVTPEPAEALKVPATHNATATPSTEGRSFIHPLQMTALGNFCRVKAEETAGEWKISCSCEDYRRDGTCGESRVFGLMTAERYPPDYCVAQESELRWEDVRNLLFARFDEDTIAHSVDAPPVGKVDEMEAPENPPLSDPWYQDKP